MFNSEYHLARFKEFYFIKNGTYISDKDAMEFLEDLTMLVEKIYIPMVINSSVCAFCAKKVHFPELLGHGKARMKEFAISGKCGPCQDKPNNE